MAFYWRISFEPSTWFKKFYCAKCGARLQKILSSRAMTEEELWQMRKEDTGCLWWAHPPAKNTRGIIQDEFFTCPECRNNTSVEKQLGIRKKQKKLKRNILTEEEFESVKCQKSYWFSVVFIASTLVLAVILANLFL